MRIGITNDHRGVKLKKKLIKYLVKKGHSVLDCGCSTDFSVDYPIYALDLANKVKDNEVDMGIAICGTGIGMCIACNKVNGIRCSKPANVKEAKLSRLHNDANILALSSSFTNFKNLDIVDAFINTNFSGDERHVKRIELIDEYEKSRNKRVKKEVKEND